MAATAPPLCTLQFHHRRLSSLAPPTPKLTFHPFLRSPCRYSGLGLLGCPHAAISGQAQDGGEKGKRTEVLSLLTISGTFDPELRSVLELATDAELYELERILFGPSYFSPLLKSIAQQRADVDYLMIKEDIEERDDFISILESRFLFLAADARSTLRGWRPSYRNVLLDVRKKLNIPCSSKLSTEDLEVEIFLHLLQDNSREESGTFPNSWESYKITGNHSSLEFGLSQSALKVGVEEFRSIILKGGGMLTIGKIYRLFARRLSGKMVLEAANYRIKNEVIKKGAAGAVTRYLGLRSMTVLLGPMLWGTFLADVVIQMLGTDYARILRAIYAFAQIRVTRTYRLPSDFNGGN